MLSGDLPQSYWNWFGHSKHMLREEKKQINVMQSTDQHFPSSCINTKCHCSVLR